MKTTLFARRACAFGLSAALVLSCAPIYAFADTTTGTDTAVTATDTLNQTGAKTLVNNLAKRFIITGSDAAIDHNTAPAAYALNAADMFEYIDVAAVKANLEKSKTDEYFNVGRLAKYVLILQCAGADIGEYESQLTVQESIYSNVIILRAVDSKNTELVSGLIDAIVADLDAETGLVAYAGNPDYQTSAQALEALAPYVSTNDTAKAAAEKLAGSLAAAQQSTGAWQVQDWSTGAYKDDVDTTAEAVIALNMYSQSAFDAAAPTAIEYLLDCANDDFTGIKADLVYSEPMSASIVFQALVASGYWPYDIAATQTIKVSPASQTVKYKKVKKAKQTVSFKVKGVQTLLSAKAADAESKKALKVACVAISDCSETGSVGKTKVKVTVKKGTKKGTYKVKMFAKASGAYAKSNAVTVKVVVK